MDTIAAVALMRRSSIGFDHFFSVLDHAIKARDRAQYPPYNIEKTSEDAYRLTLAVAGWAPAEIAVTARPRLLVVSGRKPEGDSKRYLHRGIPWGSFEHRFDLADDVEAREAQLANGLLTIELARVLPDAPASRRISITDTAGRATPRGGPGLKLVRSRAQAMLSKGGDMNIGLSPLERGERMSQTGHEDLSRPPRLSVCCRFSSRPLQERPVMGARCAVSSHSLSRPKRSADAVGAKNRPSDVAFMSHSSCIFG